MSQSPTLILTGPTGAGKTDLAIELAQRFPFEIISVDSAMVYKRLDIGAAKPTSEELAKAPHRLINIREPWEVYSVGDFVADVQREIAEIRAKGKIPLLVGGTMMYFYALLNGLSDLPEADETVRAQIESEAQQIGWPALHRKIQSIDPMAAAKIKPNDQQRIQRVLEVYELTGKPLSAFWGETSPVLNKDDVVMMAVAPKDRSVLHDRIAKRWHKMIEQGLLDEVRALYDDPHLSASMPSMRSVGYRQVWEYFDGLWSASERDEKAIVATRRLAKRQLTWLRSFEQAQWFDSLESGLFDNVTHAIETQLSKYNLPNPCQE